MTRYRAFINGQNFLFRNENGDVERNGFYVTRDVEADSFEKAELEAVELIRNENKLREAIVNEHDNPPMIYVENLRILDAEEDSLNNSGFVFYTGDDNEK
jgi:hypothetical protein